MSLMLSLFAATVTASCVPEANPTLTRGEVVEEFMASMGSHDVTRLGQLIKPGAKAVFDGGAMPLDGLMGMLNPKITVTVVETRFNPDKTILVRYHGDDAENVTTVSFTQEGGCVTEMKQVDQAPQ